MITGIFDLLITVCFVAFALFGVLSGLKLLAGSKASGSSHDVFGNFFFIESIIMLVFVALLFTAALFQGWDNNYWIPYLIVNAIFYVGSIVLMLISKSKSGIVAPILFIVGIACFMIATSYEIGGWWVSALFAVALYGVEAMAVLSAIFEDKCFSKKYLPNKLTLKRVSSLTLFLMVGVPVIACVLRRLGRGETLRGFRLVGAAGEGRFANDVSLDDNVTS